ncbi:membrane metallo-endopeptidase-like 1 [Haemaphysalis longicornis]
MYKRGIERILTYAAPVWYTRKIFDPFQKAEWTRGWSEEAKRHYDKAYDCFRKAYGKSWQPRSYRRLFGDLAPIGSIYSAFRPSPTKDRQLADLREFNPQETFFIAFCHVQCVKNPLDEVAKARCNVPLRNLPEFAATFKCASGTPMNPPEKCRLW